MKTVNKLEFCLVQGHLPMLFQVREISPCSQNYRKYFHTGKYFFSEGPSGGWHAVEEGVKGKEAFFKPLIKEMGLL